MMGSESPDRCALPASASLLEEARSTWRQAVAAYQSPQLRRSLWQLANSVVPYLALWYLAYRLLAVSYWLALPRAGPGRRLPDPGLHHLPRLRPRLVLRVAQGQRRGRLPDRRADPHALPGLAGRARAPPRDRRRPRPARHRRRVDHDGGRVPRSELLATARLPALPQPARDVRARPAVRVRHQAAASPRPAAARADGAACC